jgi:hypothetical protein
VRGRPWSAAPASLLARLDQRRGRWGAVLKGGSRQGGRARRGGRGLGVAAGSRPKEEERVGKRREKEKGEKGKEKEEKKKGNRKRKIREEKKGFRKIGEFLGKLGEGFLQNFLGFSDTGVNLGTTMMARQTGRRDRGGAGFPS